MLLISLSIILGACEEKGSETKIVKEPISKPTITEKNEDKMVRSDLQISYKDVTIPTKNESLLYMGIQEDNSDYLNKIISLDNKGKQEIVTSSEYKESTFSKIMSNNDWLVYTDGTLDGYQNKIFAINFKTKEKQLLSESDSKYITADSPYLYKNYVSWIYLKVENDKAEPVVILYDLKKKSKKEIAKVNEYSLLNNFVHIQNNKIVWTDHKDGEGEYHVYSIDSEKHDVFTSPYPYPGYAEISNNMIFSINFKDPSKWSDQSVGYFNIETKEYKELFPTGKHINYLATSSETLAIVDSENKLQILSLKDESFLQPIQVETLHPNVDFIQFNENGELLAITKNPPDFKTSSVSIFNPSK